MRIVLLSLVCACLAAPTDAAAQTTTSGLQLVGRVLDAATRVPMAEVRVTLSGLARINPMTPPLQAITDESGVFSFNGLPPGRVRLLASHPGYTYDPKSTNLIELTTERAVTNVELLLRRGAVMTGRVLDARGEPLPAISVMLVRKMPTNMIASGMAAIPSTTNDLGEFRLVGLTEGEYILLASMRSAPPISSPVQPVRRTALVPTFYPGVASRDQAQGIIVRAGETVEGIELRMFSAPAFTVSGVVVNQNGRIVPDAIVSLYYETGINSPPPSSGGRTNPDGSFVITGVVSGKYKIAASVLVRSGTSVMSTAGSPADRQDLVVNDADVAGLVIVAPPPRQN